LCLLRNNLYKGLYIYIFESKHLLALKLEIEKEMKLFNKINRFKKFLEKEMKLFKNNRFKKFLEKEMKLFKNNRFK